MNPDQITLKQRLEMLKPKHWALLGAGAVLLLIMANSGSSGVDPATWDCDNIKDDIIAMSQEEDLQVLEIGEVLYVSDYLPTQLSCQAPAEWSRGRGHIEYSARVSEGNNIILSYRQY